ncbi:MAG: inositol monophosphatase [Leptospirales bacterium]|nr:inositol monophosphatase [Leptospirales bacterium]
MMKETAMLPFPQDEVEARLKLLVRVLPGLGMNLLAMQKDVHISRSPSDDEDFRLMQRAEGAIESELVDTLLASFPADRVNGEMQGRVGRPDGEFDWWIDALDGARNYIHGLPHYCISAGLCFRTAPVAGVVLSPVFSDLYHAIYGGGAFRNHEPIQVSTVSEMGRSLVATGLPYHRQEIIADLMGDINAFMLSGAGLRRSGSAVLDLCWIAEGRIDAFWERGLSPHDLAAGALIVTEAGGRLSTFDGLPYQFSMPDVIAANALLHPRVVETLQRARKVEGMN